MSSQTRLILFLVLSITLVFGLDFLMDRLGLKPPPPKPAPIEAQPLPGAGNPAVVAKTEDATEKPPAEGKAAPATAAVVPGKPETKEPPLARPGELRIGSAASPEPADYHLEVDFDQRGAGVRRLASARYAGETADGIPDKKTRLELIRTPTNDAPRAFSVTLRPASDSGDAREIPLDLQLWEVVRSTPDAPAVRPISKPGAVAGTTVEGQEIAFRANVPELGVTVTKTYRIWKGEDGLEFDLAFSGDKDARLSYKIYGPHGIPIEGEAFTANFRDVFFGQLSGTSTTIVTKTAAEVVKAKDAQEVYQTLPIRFAGVENQYFAVFLEPFPAPTSEKDRRDREAAAFIAREDVANTAKSDVGVELVSLPIIVGPNLSPKHSYRVYAGPKTTASLAPYGAEDLASYRKWQLITIPFASELAKYIISPLLDRIYGLTQAVAQLVGLRQGNYGIAIILLTITVRLFMFPISRKQALMAKRMQDLQPQLMAIKEKYKDDKEAQTRETLSFYKRTGFNPAAGCLPALIQLPIFVGLWQSLNNSVALRHSGFLYIKNLAAPDMLFKFPVTVPFLGDYFNLLPFFVVGLMLVQTKLFTPPPTTDEARMQQKMMKYMMIFMAVMFYKVPSGLGLYFITSSLWQICERLLLPKMAARHAAAAAAAESEVDPTVSSLSASKNGTASSESDGAKSSGGGWITRKLEKLIEDAEKQRTIRNSPAAPGSNETPRTPDRSRSQRPKPPGGGKRK
ncbi:MAG: membrane protein insertase YidC [Isosphaeraceae bacterium]|nr:membrane protein insertase YidC [Isosphaeraceae bacterium]